ncbi:DUF1772 domain-containing protein [Actinomadura sp. WMMB 499]|uniref:anthrone oxygenase family protein n=1 Tax=Actinomadura sp. WMMB 499 TaxID=1219491 RepID=UPI00124498CD|nr:anthrone oxygenase family protein [Actinomadura sp. WMMB 499]QFG26644.1 DUF1772 domain-containing protein [Actinomadura sp. WMMB 499]
MKNLLTLICAAVSIVGAAGMAGTFFGFSTGVMPGLNAARPSSAIDAMQGMNQKIQNPLFIVMFVLTPVIAVLAAILLLTLDQKAAAILFFAAAAVYVLGALFPSFAVNIPMNEALDKVEIPADPAEAARVWSDHSGRWTAWNTVRAVAGWASVLAMAAGAYFWGRDA